MEEAVRRVRAAFAERGHANLAMLAVVFADPDPARVEAIASDLARLGFRVWRSASPRQHRAIVGRRGDVRRLLPMLGGACPRKQAALDALGAILPTPGPLAGVDPADVARAAREPTAGVNKLAVQFGCTPPTMARFLRRHGLAVGRR